MNFSDLQTIDRQQNTILRWDPTGYTADDVMTIDLEGLIPVIAVQPFTLPEHGPVTCRVRATDGQTVLPPSLFRTAASGPRDFLRLTLTKRPDRLNTVSIPLTDGTVPAVFQYTAFEVLPILIK